MNERNGQTLASDGDIDSRILTHVLTETAQLLEDSQTHAIIEPPLPSVVAALSQANWRLATISAWVLQQLDPSLGDGMEGMRLIAPAPNGSGLCGDQSADPFSEPLSVFLQRVGRLHDRACRLHELVSTPTHVPGSEPLRPAISAQIIQAFPSTPEAAPADNPIKRSQRQLSWLFTAR